MKLPIANFFWNAYLKKRLEFFSDQEIGDLPALDWRIFCFPTVAILLDFLACKECKLIIVMLLIFQENLCSRLAQWEFVLRIIHYKEWTWLYDSDICHLPRKFYREIYSFCICAYLWWLNSHMSPKLLFVDIGVQLTHWMGIRFSECYRWRDIVLNCIASWENLCDNHHEQPTNLVLNIDYPIDNSVAVIDVLDLDCAHQTLVWPDIVGLRYELQKTPRHEETSRGDSKFQHLQASFDQYNFPYHLLAGGSETSIIWWRLCC